MGLSFPQIKELRKQSVAHEKLPSRQEWGCRVQKPVA